MFILNNTTVLNTGAERTDKKLHKKLILSLLAETFTGPFQKRFSTYNYHQSIYRPLFNYTVVATSSD